MFENVLVLHWAIAFIDVMHYRTKVLQPSIIKLNIDFIKFFFFWITELLVYHLGKFKITLANNEVGIKGNTKTFEFPLETESPLYIANI